MPCTRRVGTTRPDSSTRFAPAPPLPARAAVPAPRLVPLTPATGGEAWGGARELTRHVSILYYGLAIRHPACSEDGRCVNNSSTPATGVGTIQSGGTRGTHARSARCAAAREARTRGARGARPRITDVASRARLSRRRPHAHPAPTSRLTTAGLASCEILDFIFSSVGLFCFFSFHEPLSAGAPARHARHARGADWPCAWAKSRPPCANEQGQVGPRGRRPAWQGPRRRCSKAACAPLRAWRRLAPAPALSVLAARAHRHAQASSTRASTWRLTFCRTSTATTTTG